MDGPKTPITFSSLAQAQVIGYVPEQNAVYVRLASGQTPVIPARMLYTGLADQYRIQQEPLPLVGTWGVVAFLNNDDRFPIWLGSYYSTIQDAITSSSVIQDSQIKYLSHWSGLYSFLDGFGNYYLRFPEGTDIRINGNNVPPATYRHVVQLDTGVDSGIPQLRVQLPDSERVPNPPATFFVSLNHPSGASATITPSGTVTIVGGNPQLASLTITPSGDVHIQTGAGSGQTGPTADFNAQTGLVTITGQNGNSVITMDSSGNIVIQSAGGSVTVEAATDITINASADITIEAAAAIDIEATAGDIFLATASHPAGESIDVMINTFNIHTHGQLTGSGTQPTPQLP